MGIYIYEIERNGQREFVEHICRLSERTEEKLIVVDGEEFPAVLVPFGTADAGVNVSMAKQWGYTRETADLPPVNARPQGQ